MKKSTFEGLFRDYRPFVLIMMILLSAIGIGSFMNLPKESLPEVGLPFFNIMATYPGADSETIEQQVMKKIEEKLPSVKNISTFSSVSANNVGVINLEFKRWTDKSTAYADLRSAVDEVKSSLPSGVKDVTVTKTDPKDVPIYSFAINGSYYPSVLYDKVSNMEDDLKRISWVDKVVIVGKYTYQVEVDFNYDKLRQYNLRLPSLIDGVSQAISQKPIDKKRLDGNLYSFEVRTYPKQWENIAENLSGFKTFLENVVLVNKNGNTIQLKDVASVNATHPFYQRMSYVNGDNAVTFMVYKVPGSDILKVIAGIKDYLASKSQEFQENKISYQEMYSEEIMINQTFNSFVDGFKDTSLLIMIIATIFLGIRGSIAIAITFPFVYLLTFVVLQQFGYTFNSIVSVALNLSLGIMVDNLIVIAQGLEDGLRKGYSKFDAIKHTLSIYWKPLLIGNFVTISMFLPLGFLLSGKIGEFMKFLPATVNVTLLFSIVVAFVFLPMVLSYMNFKPQLAEHGAHENKLIAFFSRFSGSFDAMYKKILRYPKFFVIFFYCFFFAVIGFFAKFGAVDFMPLTDKDNIYVNIRYTRDTSMKENREESAKIYGYIQEFFRDHHQGVVKTVSLSAWDQQSTSALDNTLYRTGFNPDLMKINIVLTGTEERDSKDSALVIYPELKTFLDQKTAADPILSKKLSELSIFIQKSGPSEGKDVTFNLSASGKTDSEIKLLSKEYETLLPKLQTIPGTFGWSSSLEYTNGKAKITYDLDRLSQLGISPAELDAFLYGINQESLSEDYLTDYKGNGIAITNLNDLGKDVIPVKWFVSYVGNSGQTIDFKDLMIPGTNVYVNSVIKSIELEPQIKSIRHLEGKLVLKVEANKNPSVALSSITSVVNTMVAAYPDLKLAYGADVKDMAQSWSDMWLAFIAGFIIMFAVLVLNFKNFAQPIIMMLTMPLFITGALFFLLLSGQSMSMLVGIGLFGLIGVGLAHIIYLLNRFNELQEHSEWIADLTGAILESVRSRLEPIFLTTTITAIGLFVLAASDEMWRAFALSFAGGLILGTTITLVFIPCMLQIVYGKRFKPKA